MIANGALGGVVAFFISVSARTSIGEAYGAGIGTVALGATIFSAIFNVTGEGSAASAAAGVAAIVVFFFLSVRAFNIGWQGLFLFIFSVGAIAVCFGAAKILPPVIGEAWKLTGTALLFFGLIALINAPFDWMAIGLTRFLLRLGLQKGGPWPYFFAVCDALVAVVLVIILGCLIVLGVDCFDKLALSVTPGSGILPPMCQYLTGIRSNPQKTEYWWIYITVFSTMIPSLINLFIAGFSFFRGFPPAHKFLKENLRDGESMPLYPKVGAAIILTFETAFALVLALIVQLSLLYLVVKLDYVLGDRIIELPCQFAGRLVL